MDWYPHNIDAYDGKTRTLTLAEDGAYCRLLRWYYKHEEPLPDDDVELAAICRCTIDEWLAVAPKVRRYFVTRDTPTNILSTKVLVHEVCKKILFSQNKRRKDWKLRQEKIRKNNGLEDVTRDTPVGHASVTLPEESKVEEIREVSKEVSIDGAVAPRPSALKGSRLGKDWKPSEKNHTCGASLNLITSEIEHEADAFRDYFHGPDAAKPIKKDWDGAFNNWLRRSAAEIIRRRGWGKTGSNNADRGSILAARDKILAKAGIFPERDGAESLGLQVIGGSWPNGNPNGSESAGPIIDADYRERSLVAFDGSENPDTTTGGSDNG